MTAAPSYSSSPFPSSQAHKLLQVPPRRRRRRRVQSRQVHPYRRHPFLLNPVPRHHLAAVRAFLHR
jgi:hypothetical protein